MNMALALVFMHAGLPGPGTGGGAMAVGFAGYGISLVAFMLGLRHLGRHARGVFRAGAVCGGGGVACGVWRA
ncbi:hypothetical protein RAA17_14195 [Komagataeibacter rhaeticus]|nr:hypothetical protein [Komagataeibacter rhaeticus]